jgi:hypothetical protein
VFIQFCSTRVVPDGLGLQSCIPAVLLVQQKPWIVSKAAVSERVYALHAASMHDIIAIVNAHLCCLMPAAHELLCMHAVLHYCSR